MFKEKTKYNFSVDSQHVVIPSTKRTLLEWVQRKAMKMIRGLGYLSFEEWLMSWACSVCEREGSGEISLWSFST